MSGRFVAVAAVAAGLDGDPRMIQQAKNNDPAHAQPISPASSRAHGPIHSQALATLLNHTLTVIHQPEIAQAFFQQARRSLLPGGVLVIDDPGPTLWQQLASGSLCQGIDGTGTEQCIFPYGDNSFIWRRGTRCRHRQLGTKASDRIYRIWGRSELVTIAQLAGFTLQLTKSLRARG